MSALDNILALLNHWSQWKSIVDAPGKIAALEERINQLEAKLAPGGDICPYCENHTLQLVDRKPDPLFGKMGLYMHYFECSSCGKKTEKQMKS